MTDRYDQLRAEWRSVFGQYLKDDNEYIKHKREDELRAQIKADILRRMGVHLERMDELRRQMRKLRRGGN